MSKININTPTGAETLLKTIFGTMPYCFEKLDEKLLIKTLEECIINQDDAFYGNDYKFNANWVYFIACQNAITSVFDQFNTTDDLDDYLDTAFDDLPMWEQKCLETLVAFCNTKDILDFFQIDSNDVASSCKLLVTPSTAALTTKEINSIHGAFYVLHMHTSIFDDLDEQCGLEYADYFEPFEDDNYIKNGFADYESLFEFNQLEEDDFVKAAEAAGFEVDDERPNGKHQRYEVYNDRISVYTMEIAGKVYLPNVFTLWDVYGCASQWYRRDGEAVFNYDREVRYHIQ